jgi:D-alanine-D-alanine ligase
MADKLRVGVILGGRSGEHEVSVTSASCVIDAMDRDKYDVVPIGITKQGSWFAFGDVLGGLKSGTVEDRALPVALIGEPSRRGIFVVDGGASRWQELDVIFPVLHGPYGEDGTLQGLLEMVDIPYVGAGVLGSALSMDKVMTKVVLEAKGLPVVDYVTFLKRDWERDREGTLKAVESEFPYPCFIKPANLGSSVGISKAHDREELISSIDLATRYDRRVLVERSLDVREIECSVLGNDEPAVSLPGEIVPCNEFYDYRAKYIDDRSELIIPARLPEEVQSQIRQLAASTFLAVEASGMARVDLFIDRNDESLYINELNTIPGFTPISMYPKLWEASGVSYPELIDRLISLAIERHAERSLIETSWDVV